MANCLPSHYPLIQTNPDRSQDAISQTFETSFGTPASDVACFGHIHIVLPGWLIKPIRIQDTTNTKCAATARTAVYMCAMMITLTLNASNGNCTVDTTVPWRRCRGVCWATMLQGKKQRWDDKRCVRWHVVVMHIYWNTEHIKPINDVYTVNLEMFTAGLFSLYSLRGI